MVTSSSSSSSITTQWKLMDLRFHIAFTAIFTVVIFYFLLLGPSFLSVVSFFWPLLLSTGIFLATVVVLRLISPLSDDSDKPGADLIDYVAGSGVGASNMAVVETEGKGSDRDTKEGEVETGEEQKNKEQHSKNQ